MKRNDRMRRDFERTNNAFEDGLKAWPRAYNMEMEHTDLEQPT